MSLFSATHVIEKKRDKLELTESEILEFIQGVAAGSIPDYQATAFLMAVFLNGMTKRETISLTKAMLSSGERFDLSTISGPKIDKHSTGGVGDKVSLILAPLAAACGLTVPMMSGRGLGHSGGTLDKLESIPGFNVKLEKSVFEKILREVGFSMIGQTESIAPADKKLYALRDVTGTVECIPLIVSSILSKKLAEGASGLVLDVKVGNGAFMKTQKQAKLLAKTLVSVAKGLGMQCRALLTNMDQPLGYSVGNSLEVIEALEILKGAREVELSPHPPCSSHDLKELTLSLCAHMLLIAKKVDSLQKGRRLAIEKLQNGDAMKRFLRMTELQGGSAQFLKDPTRFELAKTRVTVRAKTSGVVSRIDTLAIGHLGIELGAGRKQASDTIDPGVGFVFHRKCGQSVKKGDALVTVFASEKTHATLDDVLENTASAIDVSRSIKTTHRLIYEPCIK